MKKKIIKWLGLNEKIEVICKAILETVNEVGKDRKRIEHLEEHVDNLHNKVQELRKKLYEHGWDGK